MCIEVDKKELIMISDKFIIKALMIVIILVIGNVVYASDSTTIKELPRQVTAPGYELLDLEDEIRTMKEFSGKVIAVNFWATWCPPCREELPSMQDTYDEFKADGFIIVGINVGEEWSEVASFLESYDLDFPILLDEESNTMFQWGGYGLPTTFIVDRNGEITHRVDGGRDWNNQRFRDALAHIITGKE